MGSLLTFQWLARLVCSVRQYCCGCEKLKPFIAIQICRLKTLIDLGALLSAQMLPTNDFIQSQVMRNCLQTT